MSAESAAGGFQPMGKSSGQKSRLLAACRSRTSLVLVTAWLALSALPARAERDPQSGAPTLPSQKRENPSPITDHFYVRGTFFSPAVTTRVQVNAQSGTPGTLASGERDLGLPGRLHQGRIEMMFRMRERNKLRVDFFEADRSGAQTLSRQILFGNLVFNPGDRVTSSLDYRSFDLTYTYSFIRRDWLEIGTGLAVHFLQAEARGAVRARELSQDVSGAGAFPTIPIEATWRIWRGFSLTAHAQYFHLAAGNFEGSLGDYHGDLQYRATRNFAVGAGYSIIRSSLDLKESNFPGLFRLNVRGPEAFFRVSF
jgi:hypothetical protein